MTVRILSGDSRSVLTTLPSASVHCIVTSPPYYGLRDYGTAQWEGGDPGCDHKQGRNGAGRADGKVDDRGQRNRDGVGSMGGDCRKCGATRIDQQIGLEATPDAYVAELVAVFRECRRVLREDGVMFLNLGDSFSSGVPNIPDLLTSRLKDDVFFFGCAYSRGRSSDRIHVLIYDKHSPNSVFEPLFRAKWVLVKQGQHDLCQVGGALNTPVECWVSGSLRLAFPNYADLEGLINLPENIGVIITAGNLRPNPSLRDAIALTVKHGQAPFAVEVSGEPITEGIASDIPVRDAVTLNTAAIGVSDADAVNEAVAFFDGVNLRARGCRDFTIRSATAEHVAFRLERGCELRFQSVTQLFLLRDGLTPYRTALADATKYWNTNRQKQELGIPEMVKRALMEDGWICRQTIIWHKPNPMPESVTDRCTKAHEYVFLLTKSPQYSYDADAIAEPVAETSIARISQNDGHPVWNGNRSRSSTQGPQTLDINRMVRANGKRNRRSVWTIATQSFGEAHFATMPPDLAELCIKAGCPSEGTVLDPFGGAGTTGLVADRLGRNAILIELNPDYARMARQRIEGDGGMFANVLELVQ